LILIHKQHKDSRIQALIVAIFCKI